MPKFFVDSNNIKDNKIEITGEDVNHIATVLRSKVGDTLNLANKDSGVNYITKIVRYK